MRRSTYCLCNSVVLELHKKKITHKKTRLYDFENVQFYLFRASNIIKSSIFDSFWHLEGLNFHVSTYPFEKICNLTPFCGFYVSSVKFDNFWIFDNYSFHQELQFDESTSLFRIDCNLTPLVPLASKGVVELQIRYQKTTFQARSTLGKHHSRKNIAFFENRP